MKLDKEELLRLIEDQPINAEHHQELGKYYLREKDYDSAEKALHRSLELNCDDGWTYMYMGNLRHLQDRIEEALGFFQYAEKLMPDISTPLWCIAEMNEKLKRYDKANEYFEKAADTDANDADSIRKLKEWREWYVKH